MIKLLLIALALIVVAPNIYANGSIAGEAGIGFGTILENQGLTDFPSTAATTASTIVQPSAVAAVIQLPDIIGLYDLESCTVYFNTGVVNTCSQFGNFVADMAISPNSTMWQRFSFSGLQPIVASGIFSLNNNTVVLQNDLVAETAVINLSLSGDRLTTETTTTTFTEVDTWRMVAAPPTSTPPPDDSISLSGSVQDTGGTGLCAMVLASGKFTFSCNPNGPFTLTDLPRENNGTVTRQIYVAGFFPSVDVLPDSVSQTVIMQRSGTCPDYNSPPDPGFSPGSAGKWINISGRVLLQNTQTPICAMVLANGQFAFSCDGTGSYALNIPLDNNGQFKLQVYAAGFAPTIQAYDEFSPNNSVRMARATECQ